MTDNPTLFDQQAEAKQAGDEGVARAEAHADAEWFELAKRVVYAMSVASTREFTADDVWEVMELRYPDATTHEPRAMGAVMRHAARAGWVRSTGRYVPGRRKVGHGHPTRVWASRAHPAS